MKATRRKDSIIRASELAQYAYCAKAWWLARVEGVQPSNVGQLESGDSAHARHGAGVALAGWLARAALVCLALGAGLTILWLIATLC